MQKVACLAAARASPGKLLAFTPSLRQNPVTDSPPDPKRLNSRLLVGAGQRPRWRVRAFTPDIPHPLPKQEFCGITLRLWKERRGLTAYIPMGWGRASVGAVASGVRLERTGEYGLPARTLVGATVGVRQIAPGETVNKNRPKVPARLVTDKLPAAMVWK